MFSGVRFTMVMLTVMFGGAGLLFLGGGLMMIQQSGATTDAMLFTGAGAISALIGFTPLLIFLRKRWIKNKVIRRGEKVQSEFLDIVLAEYSVNNWRPFLIRSQWHDQVTNKLYIFKSGPLTNNPEHFLKKNIQIPVYINPRNPKQYYMDLDAISPSLGILLK